MEYRKIIEKGTVGLAREKIVSEDFAFLEETYAAMTCETCECDAFVRADFAFHCHLARISQNSMIIKVHELLHEILFTAMRDIVHLTGRTNGPVYHRKIIDALKRGDKAECEALMEEHIEKNIEVIRREAPAGDSGENAACFPFLLSGR
jgi:GntR family transcriptional repressor for pyruvate dehydrogenase complex